MVMPFFLQLLVDGGVIDLVGSDVIHDLHALTLFHVEDRQLAHHPVGVADVTHIHREIVEEIGRPQPAEVADERLLERLIVGSPAVFPRVTRARLDVIDVGVRVDHRRPALLLEAEHVSVEDRPGAGRRRTGRRGHLLAADHGGQRQNTRLRSRGSWSLFLLFCGCWPVAASASPVRASGPPVRGSGLTESRRRG